MHLTTQKQNIQDKVAFVRSLAVALVGMHAQNRGHGSISMDRLGDWMDGEGCFDLARFEQCRASTDAPAENGAQRIVDDIKSFAQTAAMLITGQSSGSDKSFRAAFYLGRDWPDAFVHEVEKALQMPDANSLPSMAAMIDALGKKENDAAIPKDDQRADQVDPGLPAVEFASPPLVAPQPEVPQQAAPTVPPPPVQRSFFRFALRNASVGKPYAEDTRRIAAAIAAKRGDDPNLASFSRLDLPADCGLVFDSVAASVAGTPTQAFEGQLQVEYVPKAGASGIPGVATLLVNPDPASLWKDLPTSPDAPYQKADTDDRSEVHGAFRVVAASRRGRSHANKGDFRDDDFAIGYAPEFKWLIVVVADGAGSATYSRRGSQIACVTARNRLTTVLNGAQYNLAEGLFQQHQDWRHPEVQKALRQSLYEAALVAHQQLREEAESPAEAITPAPVLRNYDTTLLMLVIKDLGEGVVAATFSIGDGGVGLFTSPIEGVPLTKADSGEHAGQTLFLTFPSTLANTEENLQRRFHLMQTSGFAGALAMTDGITDPKFPSDAAFDDPAQWSAVWNELQPELSDSKRLLDWMKFFSPGNHDDRTLVAVLPAEPKPTA
jgi:serine/threonine protein phosphatase PrpC